MSGWLGQLPAPSLHPVELLCGAVDLLLVALELSVDLVAAGLVPLEQHVVRALVAAHPLVGSALPFDELTHGAGERGDLLLHVVSRGKDLPQRCSAVTRLPIAKMLAAVPSSAAAQGKRPEPGGWIVIGHKGRPMGKEGLGSPRTERLLVEAQAAPEKEVVETVEVARPPVVELAMVHLMQVDAAPPQAIQIAWAASTQPDQAVRMKHQKETAQSPLHSEPMHCSLALPTLVVASGRPSRFAGNPGLGKLAGRHQVCRLRNAGSCSLFLLPFLARVPNVLHVSTH